MIRLGLAVVAAVWVAGCLTPVDAGSSALSPRGDGGTATGGAAGGGSSAAGGGGGSAPSGPRPNVLVLIDKSGSMAVQVDPSCSDCGTRVSALRAALDVTLSTHPSTARLSLAAFPTNNICGESGAPAKLRVAPLAQGADGAAQLSAQTAEVNASIQRISSTGTGDDVVTGGTPTAAALLQLGELPALADTSRQNFVLLVTDGVPNCSPTNPNNCTTSACRCTLASCGTSTAAQFCTLGCLDDTDAVSVITGLRLRGIRTVILGLGGEISADTTDTLSRMAVAGAGPARTCTTYADCGGGADSCDTQTGTCRLPYFHGNSSAELQAELLKIFSLF